jgi:hypothetical protein
VRIIDGRGLDGTHGVDETPGTTLTLDTQPTARTWSPGL